MEKIRRIGGWLATALAMLAILALTLSRFTPYALRISIDLPILMGIGVVGLIGGFLLRNKTLMATHALGITVSFMLLLITP